MRAIFDNKLPHVKPSVGHLLTSPKCSQVMAGAGAEARAARLQHLDDMLDMPHPDEFDQVLPLLPPRHVMYFLPAWFCGYTCIQPYAMLNGFACPHRRPAAFHPCLMPCCVGRSLSQLPANR